MKYYLWYIWIINTFLAIVIYLREIVIVEIKIRSFKSSIKKNVHPETKLMQGWTLRALLGRRKLVTLL